MLQSYTLLDLGSEYLDLSLRVEIAGHLIFRQDLSACTKAYPIRAILLASACSDPVVVEILGEFLCHAVIVGGILAH